MPVQVSKQQRLIRSALLGIGILGLLAVAVGGWRWQQANLAAEDEARREALRSSEPDEMTFREYEHLQNLPAYGVVKPGSELDRRIRRAAPGSTDGGNVTPPDPAMP